MHEEKRKHTRLPVLHEMDEPIRIATQKESVPGILVDLSASGMAILTFASLNIGAELNLSIDIPGLKTQPLKGKVVWANAKGEMWRIGIAFLHIDQADFRHINNLAFDCNDCDTKIGLGVSDVCFDKCSYLQLCSKPQKPAPTHK
jgi:hypothetical protein